MNYRPEVDGMRALAVTSVILYHAGFTVAPGGFVGVDVFFVISGFLISGLLMDNLRAGRFSIARFYERRARRILPALFVVLAATVPLALTQMNPLDFKLYAEGVGTIAIFVSNLLFMSQAGYFAPEAATNPLLHTWSLAVEEQFYILFPPFLALVWRLGGQRAVTWAALGLGLVSLGFSEWAWRAYPSQTFFFLPSRAWELLLGVLCATRLPGGAPRRNEWAAAAGLAMILVSVFVYDGDIPFPSLWALLPVGGTALVLLFGAPRTLAGRVLSARPVVGLGLVSYSAYLWHQPILAFLRLRTGVEPSATASALAIVATLAVSALSWKFVEQPFRRGPTPLLPRRWQVFAASGLGIVAFFAFGLWGELTDGRSALWKASASATERQVYSLYEAAQQGPRRSDDGACRFDTNKAIDPYVDRLLACRLRFGPGIAVIGDSHSMDLTEALISTGARPFVVGFNKGNCKPFERKRLCPYDQFAALVADHPGLFDRVILEIAVQHLVSDRLGREAEQLFRLSGPEERMSWQDLVVNEARIAATAAYLQGLARHVPVIWLSPRYEPHIPWSFVMDRGCDYDYRFRPGERELLGRVDAAIRAALAQTGVIFADQTRLLGLTFPADFMTCQALLWHDGDHLSLAGRKAFGPRLAPLLDMPVR